MHYYDFIAGLKKRFDGAGGARFQGHGDRSWSYWFRQPYNPLAFELVEQSKATRSFAAIELKLDIEGKLKRFGRLRLWAYDLDDYDENALAGAFRHASVICARAGHALLAQPHKPEVRKVVENYFSAIELDDFLIGRLANQYVGVMTDLNTKYVVLARGNPAKQRGRDALAYVDPREDKQTLGNSGLADAFGDRMVIVYINNLSAVGAGAEAPAQQADRALKPGATVLHELTHLCGDNRADDHPLTKIRPDLRRKHTIPDQLGECYGRTACRALGEQPVSMMLNLTNADTLALLAVDLYLVQARGLPVADVLALR